MNGGVLDTGSDAFSFTNATNVNPSTVTTSNSVAITGVSSPLAVTATNGAEFSINGGAFGTSGNITNGQTLAVRLTSSASFNTALNTVVSIGTTQTTWTVTTRLADTTPAAFSFTSANNVNLSTTNTSNTVTVTGLEPNYPITVTVSGGTVDAGTSALSGTYAASKNVTTSGTGTLVVSARGTASSSFSTSVTVTVTIGGVNGTYTITTRAVDETPTAFAFTDVTGASLSTTYTSNTVTVSGLEPSTSIWVTNSGGTISTGTSAISGTYTSGGRFVTTTASGTLVVSARVTSSGSYSTAVSCVVSVGTGSDTYTVTTRAVDTTPNSFTNAFTDVGSAALSTVYTSNTITLSGMDPSQSITITCTGGTIDAGTSVLSGTFATSKTVTTSATGTVVVAARVTSSASFTTVVNCVVTCNGVSDTYAVATVGPDVTPNAFAFTDQTGITAYSTPIQSNQITISGMSPNVSVTITASGSTGFGVDAGTSALSGSYATSKTVTTSGTGTIVARARVTSSSADLTTTTCTVTLGGVSDTFSVTTWNGGGV